MHYTVCPDAIDLSGLPNGIYILRYTEDRTDHFAALSMCRSPLGFSHLYKVTLSPGSDLKHNTCSMHLVQRHVCSGQAGFGCHKFLIYME